MDADVFDRWTRTWGAGSRRDVLGWLAAAGFGIGGAGALAADVAESASGCRTHGRPCRRDRSCCSGRCRGGRCRRSPDQGVCTIRDDACAANDADRLCGDGGSETCACVLTVAGRPFCALGRLDQVVPCGDDRDCASPFGSDARCVRGGPGDCPDEPVCRRPCPTPLPA